jgi:hypothetical protein
VFLRSAVASLFDAEHVHGLLHPTATGLDRENRPWHLARSSDRRFPHLQVAFSRIDPWPFTESWLIAGLFSVSAKQSRSENSSAFCD